MSECSQLCIKFQNEWMSVHLLPAALTKSSVICVRSCNPFKQVHQCSSLSSLSPSPLVESSLSRLASLSLYLVISLSLYQTLKVLQTCDESTEERWIIFNRYQWPPAICIIIVVIHHHYHCILGRARVWNSWHCLLLQEEERCARARSRSVLKPKHSFVRTLVPLQKLLWLDLSVKIQAFLCQHSSSTLKGVQHSFSGKIAVL